MLTTSQSQSAELGVVIPVRHAGDHLYELLQQFSDTNLSHQIVVVNSGSTDLSDVTGEIANVDLIESDRPGRGYQIRLGIEHLQTPWYLLLHADSILTGDWDKAITQFVSDTPDTDKAGYFDFHLDSSDRLARILERLVNWRCHLLGLPYGDQGLLIPASLLTACGGVPDIPLMEDVHLARRITRDRLKRIGVPLKTSAQHYQQHGYVKRCAQNLIFLCLFLAGVKPATLHRWYYS